MQNSNLPSVCDMMLISNKYTEQQGQGFEVCMGDFVCLKWNFLSVQHQYNHTLV